MDFHPLSSRKIINILAVDDDPAALKLLSEMINSPLINLVTFSTVEAASAVCRSRTIPWHCWIVDLNVGDQHNGLTFIEHFRNFPYVIVLSGLGDMRLAFQATKNGALEVFDKGAPHTMEKFIECVYRTAALGFLLKGKRTDYLSVFLKLVDSVLESPVEWANEAFIGLRYLERLCNSHTALAPRYVIPLYYYLVCMLFETTGDEDGYGEWQKNYPKKSHGFLLSCRDFIREFYIEKYKPVFFNPQDKIVLEELVETAR